MSAAVYVTADVTKGLHRDAEVLQWACGAQLFEVNKYGDRCDVTGRPIHGMAVDTWVVPEVLRPRLVAELMDRRRVVFIPNLDCAIDTKTGKSDGWVRELKPLVERGLVVWSKTEVARDQLTRHGIRSTYVPWSVPDDVVRAPSESKYTFFMNAGYGGVKNRRGVDIALRAFEEVRRTHPQTTMLLKTLKHHAVPEGVEQAEGFCTRKELLRMYDSSAVMMFPSRFEGLGIPMLEALHRGRPVIATNGPPMSQWVEHEHNGLLVPALQKGRRGLTPWYEPSVRGVATAMRRMLDEPALLQRVTAPEPAVLEARQHAFRIQARSLVLGEPAPKAVSLYKRELTGRDRPTAHLRAEALRQCGWEVKESPIDKHEQAPVEKADMVLVGKVSPYVLMRLRHRSKRLVMWHYDVSDHVPARLRWSKRAASIVDLLVTPEPTTHMRALGVVADHRQILPGPQTLFSRGWGRRPAYRERASHFDRVVFFASCTTPFRHAVVDALEKEGFVVEQNVEGNHVIRATACKRMRGATALSISSRSDIDGYASARLFTSAGSGAYVLSERFKGCERLYGDDAVVWCDTPAAFVAAANASEEHKRRMADRAEEQTWRYHSWEDRVLQLLRCLGDPEDH